MSPSPRFGGHRPPEPGSRPVAPPDPGARPTGLPLSAQQELCRTQIRRDRAIADVFEKLGRLLHRELERQADEDADER